LLSISTFGPISVNTTDRLSGGSKALDKVVEEAAPKILGDLVEAWRKNVQVARMVQLRISPIDFAKCRLLEKELTDMKGIRAVNIREITEGVASVDVDWEFSPKLLADRLGEIKTVTLSITEFNANRIICTVVP
jgi:hypothetical protein